MFPESVPPAKSRFLRYTLLVKVATAVASPEGDSSHPLQLSRHFQAGLAHAAASRLELADPLFVFPMSWDSLQ